MDNKEVFSFDGLYIRNNRAYFSSNIFNGLVSYDLLTEYTEYVCEFPHQSMTKTGMHHAIHGYNNKLFFMPDVLTGYHVFDLANEKMSYYDFELDLRGKYRSVGSVRIGNIVWIVGAYINNPLIRLDLENMECEKYYLYEDNMPEELRNILKDERVLWSSVSARDRVIYGAVWGTNYIVAIDGENASAKYMKIGDCIYGASGVAICENDLYVSFLHTAQIARISLLNLTDIVWCKPNHEFSDAINLIYSAIISSGNDVVLIPEEGKNVYIVNNTGNIEVLAELPVSYRKLESKGRDKWRRVFSGCEMGGKLFAFPNSGSQLLEINVKNKNICGIEIRVSANCIDEYEKRISKDIIESVHDTGVVEESASMPFKCFLRAISEMTLENNK